MSSNRESLLRKSANKRFYQEDFSGLNLSNADFRNATVHECKFIGTDLSYANFENANCWGSDFTESVLYRTNMKDTILANTIMLPRECFGVTMTLNCDSFDSMVVSDKIFQYWLFLATMMKPQSPELADKLIATLGAEMYAKLAKVFRERQF